MKLNPYEQGVADRRNKLRNSNPYTDFTQKWGMYNRGYNKEAFSAVQPAMSMAEWRDQNEPVHGCGHMQGRGAA